MYNFLIGLVLTILAFLYILFFVKDSKEMKRIIADREEEELRELESRTEAAQSKEGKLSRGGQTVIGINCHIKGTKGFFIFKWSCLVRAHFDSDLVSADQKEQPDRPFHNVRVSQSLDWQTLCGSEALIDNFEALQLQKGRS